MLFNERMLESYLIARNRFLKPGGKLYPDIVKFYSCPFYDEQLYKETVNKAAQFWGNNNFHGVDLTSLKNKAVR